MDFNFLDKGAKLCERRIENINFKKKFKKNSRKLVHQTKFTKIRGGFCNNTKI